MQSNESSEKDKHIKSFVANVHEDEDRKSNYDDQDTLNNLVAHVLYIPGSENKDDEDETN